MSEMAGGIEADIHSVTALVAILLMLVHAVWATIVLVLRNEKPIKHFQYTGVFFWAIWLIPYFTGFFASMG